MLILRPSQDRGHANYGWLDTYHTFSFADYYDPEAMGYRALRVINEDRIAAAQGFGTHSHRDMEIITYVLEGALEHRDSLGSGGLLRPGEVQHMSAGRGIRHSEFNASEAEPLHLLQIWLLPTKNDIAPTYSQQAYPIAGERNRLHLVASSEGREGSLKMESDAELYAARLDAGAQVRHGFTSRKYGWLQVARGGVAVNGTRLAQGDGVAIEDEDAITIEAGPDGAEFLLFDLA